jgi:hypothetical protein
MDKAEALIRELDTQHAAYLETFSKVHELLAQNVAATASKDVPQPETSPSPPDGRSQRSHRKSTRTASELERNVLLISGGSSTLPASSASRTTGDTSDSDSDDDEVLYVQTPLEPQAHEMEGLRNHLKTHSWDKHGRRILDGIVGNPDRLREDPLIPNRRGPQQDRSDQSHYQIFDVGPDGSPLQLDFSHIEKSHGRAMSLWHAMKDVNPESRERKAVGRITIVREPSPILFGALHYTMNQTFDVDELFQCLHLSDLSSASLLRAFEDDNRRRRSFVFNLEYFTLIGKDREPMQWQIAAGQEDRKPGHISITRCSSVIALVLNGPKIKDVKNPYRRKARDKGPVFDPFSSWQVLNIQCYPDFNASLDVHDSTKHYVNGPEAFMMTVLGEFRDAYRRFSEITKRISKRVRPPLEFMFDSGIRDKLLFEDDEYSMARRYFWAQQTLGIMNESIKALIDAFEENFTDEVWEGKHKSLWPLLDETSARNKHYIKKMSGLRKQFGIILGRLNRLIEENNDRRREIQDLREDLFTGTSIQESRKSVNATETTVQQGHNIKLLTLVSIFFLPLTFVTSVFGMTNMPTKPHFVAFAIVTATVCVPFFVLIGSLNSRRGMHFWRRRTSATWQKVSSFFRWLTGREQSDTPELMSIKSFDSTQRSDTMRIHRLSTSVQNQQDRNGRLSMGGDEVEAKRDGEGKEGNGFAVPAPKSPVMRPTFSGERTSMSRIAEMWVDERERRRRLTYKEDV